LTTYYLLVLSY